MKEMKKVINEDDLTLSLLAEFVLFDIF